MRKSLLDLREVVKEVTKNVPASHGWPHLRKAGEIACYLALRLGIDPFLAVVSAFVHDLRWWDESERKVRKIKVGESQKATMSAEEVLAKAGASLDDQRVILEAIAKHSSRSLGASLNLTTSILRDADRASRMGYEGLLSILTANNGYTVPFYNEGNPILWDPSMPLVPNEEIKSCVDDVRACQSWWLIQETTPGKMLFRVVGWVNYQFLQIFQKNRGTYETWIPRLEEILRTQQKIRENLCESLLEKENISSYEETVLNLESPCLIY